MWVNQRARDRLSCYGRRAVIVVGMVIWALLWYGIGALVWFFVTLK
jgi:hypothetical protein